MWVQVRRQCGWSAANVVCKDSDWYKWRSSCIFCDWTHHFSCQPNRFATQSIPRLLEVLRDHVQRRKQQRIDRERLLNNESDRMNDEQMGKDAAIQKYVYSFHECELKGEHFKTHSLRIHILLNIFAQDNTTKRNCTLKHFLKTSTFCTSSGHWLHWAKKLLDE